MSCFGVLMSVGGGERSGAKEARFVAGLAASASPPRFRLELISVHQLWKSLVARPFNARDRDACTTRPLNAACTLVAAACCKRTWRQTAEPRAHTHWGATSTSAAVTCDSPRDHHECLLATRRQTATLLLLFAARETLLHGDD